LPNLKLPFRIKETRLATIVIILVFMLAFIFGYFVSWQIGIPTFIFGVSFVLLFKLKMLCRKFGPIFLFFLGLTFTFTIYSPIHEAIHYLLAYASGAPVRKVEWWFWTNSGFRNPYTNIDFTSKNITLIIITYIAPFLVLGIAFTTLWYIWFIRKSFWIYFACVPLSFNFALSHDDLGLSQIAGLMISSIVLALMLFVAVYYSKVWELS